MSYHWGMVIDLDRCTGCSACVTACHAENNMTLSTEDYSLRGRHHNWIRIERYWEGEYPNIRAKFMPILCQQCGNAPCEPVCPVYATHHTPEGLNAQVYNRCVGTRFCGNNCPYEVRVFNWLDPVFPDPLPQQLNPDVTVRVKGIIEKCTFCIQRIVEAKRRARDEGREVADGEIQPACAQTCPPGAIVFGNLDDPNSAVSKLAQSPRRYRFHEDLGTEPSVVYLKEVIDERGL
ncbi:MAG: 4Fe-4S dicluster domain-containing protein [Chloroflexi bacterium]|nr:4Fe-4S dicluster domain-containing protein [Chloroflexota bacterium]